jgi:tetratricopeptide (TPR) repeat protein
MRDSFILLLIALGISVIAGDAEIGLRLISEGEFGQACEHINKAYRKDPFSPVAQFAYARTVTNGKKAEELYTKVVNNKKASDSLKAESLYMLGCMQYCEANYESANDYFNKVRKIVRGEKSGHVKALTALLLKNFNTAETIWLERVSENSKELYYLGNTCFKQEKYGKALDYYTKASEMKDASWAASTMAGACLSALNLGNAKQSEELYTRIQKEYPASLESEMLKEALHKGSTVTVTDIPSRDDFASVDLGSGEEKKEPEKTIGDPLYTLQVGAFSSSENANTMAKKMEEDFDNVSIIKEKEHKKIFHKVRIGSFTTHDEALSFGEKELKTKGVAYRIVKVKE